ncbi:MAG: hypothetical protein WA064_05420 [Candidatus Moraniibacteriota bacterium]
MESHIKQKAIKLRSKGYSYNLIAEKLKIGKGTLSTWLKEIEYIPNEIVRERIKNGPAKSGMLRHNLRVRETKEIKELARTELGKISKRDLWMLGLGLYLGEGTKLYETIRIINSDPAIIKLAIRWFRDICELDVDNITIAIHLYPDNDVEESLNYWSREINIPLKQFRKTQIDKRIDKSEKKKRKLPYGTAHISINSNGNPNFGVKLHRRIMGWLESSLKQV